MSELILHHYPNSPFAEKVRLILGCKGLAWRSVMIPVILPKPDLVALTGGYRKTPVLQVGADIYCDTALIARVLQVRRPAPDLYPASAPLAPGLAQWADSALFWAAVPWAMQPAGVAEILEGVDAATLKAFAADRAAMAGAMRRMTLPDATVALKAYLAMLEAQCLQQAAAGPWLFGAEVSIADFSVAHCLWFIRRGGPVASLLAAYPALSAWLDRVLAIGHGPEARPMDSADAVALAAAATAHAPVAVEPGLGYDAGQPVQVCATDYGSDPVVGHLVGLTADEVVLRRNDLRAGTVHVHFPRIGFQIRKESA